MCDSVGMAQSVDPALRYTVKLVALLNLGYFGVEFAVALAIGSLTQLTFWKMRPSTG